MMKKRLISILLALALTLGLLPAAALAEGDVLPVPPDGGYELISGQTAFPAISEGDESRENTFYYSDGYFFAEGGAAAYSPALAAMSACMALAGHDPQACGDWSDSSAEIEQLLADIGCRDIFISETYDREPAPDTVAAAIARKDLVHADTGAACTLIPVVLRGVGYGREAAGNFLLGASGEHAGFAAAADTVTGWVEDYIREQSLSDELAAGNVIFWVTGYSRGAAVANLTAKRLVDAWGGQDNQVFAYTFAAPMGGDPASAGTYDNIHNVIDPGDPVARLAPAGMGFCRYGQDHPLPGLDGADELTAGMAAQLRLLAPELADELVLPDGFTRCSLSMLALAFGADPLSPLDDGVTRGEWLEQLVSDLVNWGVALKTDEAGQPTDPRESYVTYTNTLCRDGSESATMQESFCLLADALAGLDGLPEEALPDLADSLDVMTLMSGVLSWGTLPDEAKRVLLWNGLWDPVAGGLVDALPAEELDKLERAFPVVAEVLISFVLHDFDYSMWNAERGIPAGTGRVNLVHLATLLSTAESLPAPHFPEVTLAWLRSLDGNYQPSEEPPEEKNDPLDGFTDLGPEDQYRDAVSYALENGLMSGVGDGRFDPGGTFSRAMVCQTLYNRAGRPAVAYEPVFTDVGEGVWYAGAVLWAYENGLVNGYGDGRFGPNDDITREQLAAILYHDEQSRGGGFTGMWMFPLDFPDAGQLSGWADEGMHWCVMKGILTERDGGLLDPQGVLTRAEAAQAFMKFTQPQD